MVGMAVAALAMVGGMTIALTQVDAGSGPVVTIPSITDQAVNATDEPSTTPSQTPSLATATSTASTSEEPATPTSTISALCAVPAPVTPPAPGLTGARWVDVDISTQITTLYIGNAPVQVFCVSTGGPGLDTPTGTFSVLQKIPVATYSSDTPGDTYYYPDVKWSVEFKSPYYFHTAYWNPTFGEPVSHGCVNMREADAKVLYDFVSIGDKVVIHA